MAAAAQGARAGAALQMNKQKLFRSDRHFGHHVCYPCIWQCKTTVCPQRCRRLSGGIPTCTFVSPLPWTLFVALRHLQRRDARAMLSTCALFRHITEARCKSAAAAPLSVRRRQRAGMVHDVNGRPGKHAVTTYTSEPCKPMQRLCRMHPVTSRRQMHPCQQQDMHS